MILTCSSCAARFEVDSAALGEAGRKVRCGRCGHSWHQAPEPRLDVANKDQVPAPIPKLQEFDDARRRSSGDKGRGAGRTEPRRGLWTAWLLFLLVLAAIVMGLWLGRDAIVAALPEAGRLYQALGIKVGADRQNEGEGLDLRDVTQIRRLVNGEHVLLIEGAIVNITDQPRAVPQLRAEITDDKDEVVSEWSFQAEADSLPPGGLTTFQTSTKDPPPDGKLSLGFEAVKE